jgi:hypothetical protein
VHQPEGGLAEADAIGIPFGIARDGRWLVTQAILATDARLFSLGVLVVICGLILFGGSIYLLLAGIFGRKMAYLVEATCFFAFLTLLAAIWTWGFWSQGPQTPTNLGPQGEAAHWQPVSAGLQPSSDKYPVALQYPGGPWKAPNEGTKASVEPLSTAVKEYVADEANKQAGIEVQPEIPVAAGGRGAPEYQNNLVPYEPEDFTVEDVRFTTAGDRSLAAARVFPKDGGPEITVIAVHEPGKIWMYSVLFLIIGIVGFAIHVPLLDREEKKLKGIITSKPAPWRPGGTQ